MGTDSSIAARSAALCAAPLGCAFLLMVEGSGLEPAEAARPEVALQMVAYANMDLTPWSGRHLDVVDLMLAEGPRLLPLAHAVVALPEAAWWWAPLDRSAQLWTGVSDPPPPRWREWAPRSGLLSDRERYAHTPSWGFFTSTDHGGISAHLATAPWGWGDFGKMSTVPRRRYVVSPGARVYEVHGPADWHALVTAHRSGARPPRLDEVPGDRPDQLVPDWASVATEWDGVHLSFGGQLATLYAWSEGPPGPTRNWAWEIEGTWWLRWVFDDAEELEPLQEADFPPQVEHLIPPIWWPMQGSADQRLRHGREAWQQEP